MVLLTHQISEKCGKSLKSSCFITLKDVVVFLLTRPLSEQLRLDLQLCGHKYCVSVGSWTGIDHRCRLKK